jgi:hypothetical protein
VYANASSASLRALSVAALVGGSLRRAADGRRCRTVNVNCDSGAGHCFRLIALKTTLRDPRPGVTTESVPAPDVERELRSYLGSIRPLVGELVRGRLAALHDLSYALAGESDRPTRKA